MSHDDFDRDQVTDDEFFDELADTIELIDKMTRDRLTGGELERRRKKIMEQVRHDAANGKIPAPTNE